MRILNGKAAAQRVVQLERRSSDLSDLEPRVRLIVEDVRLHGDDALLRYASKWDGIVGRNLKVSQSEMERAWNNASPRLRTSLRKAAQNIRRFSSWQRPLAWSRRVNGMKLGQVVRPIGSVGCYVPGGRHPLVSSLLMTVVPAQVAGVLEISVVSPKPASEMLAAAYMLGVRQFYRVGGAQAIAALAFGTKTIPRVDKIVGPGNRYVTIAKKLVAFDCAIDFLAGPTEAVVVSHAGNPAFVAADLVAQGEHDPDALPIFITSSENLAQRTASAVKALMESNDIARQSVDRNGCVLLASSRAQAMEWANRIAPEHITVDSADLPLVQNAGSIFLAPYSAQAAGDYATGPNHVLPTAGIAHFRGGLSVLDFVKIITVQELSERGLRKIGPTITYLAEVEGLRAHAESIRVRCARA
jgi:histidinol dehydrogenase